MKNLVVVILFCSSLVLSDPVPNPDADPDPQINSLLTDRALAGHPLALGGHPLGHPVLHASHNSISAATAAARNPHSGLPFLHPVLHPTLPIPSIQPTLQSHVPVGACRLICSILDLLVFNPAFSTFISLVKAGNLISLLSQPGPLTVFAPTNDAFDLIPAPQFQALLGDPVGLKTLLLKHMTRGVIHSIDLPAGAVPLITGAGERVTVTKLPTAVTITSTSGISRIVEADNEASNGIIHVVDKVF